MRKRRHFHVNDRTDVDFGRRRIHDATPRSRVGRTSVATHTSPSVHVSATVSSSRQLPRLSQLPVIAKLRPYGHCDVSLNCAVTACPDFKGQRMRVRGGRDQAKLAIQNTSPSHSRYQMHS